VLLWPGRGAVPGWALARAEELRLIPFREFLTLRWPETTASVWGEKSRTCEPLQLCSRCRGDCFGQD